MARPRKFRKICHFPKNLAFKPVGDLQHYNPVKLTIDEYESIRLIDKEGRSQEECSVSMKVARTTVQMIYTAARRKIADAIIDGRILEIEGGDYDLCNGRPDYCHREDCHKKRIYHEYRKPSESEVRIAFPTLEANKVNEGTVLITDLNKTAHLKVYDLRDKEILGMILVDVSEKTVSFYDLLHILGVDVIVMPDYVGTSTDGLKELNIEVFKSNLKDEEAMRSYFGK